MDDKALKRPVKQTDQGALFDAPPDWRAEWWGMSDFSMGDATPSRRLTVNFLTAEDCLDFQSRLGIRLTPRAGQLVVASARQAQA
jgi:hypothetical protein